MSRKETIPEMFARISRSKTLAAFKGHCSTMHMGQLQPLICLAERSEHVLFAACLCERFADIQQRDGSHENSQLLFFYYKKSSDYFFKSGYGFEGSRVLQKANANMVSPQLQSGASFFAPVPAISQPRPAASQNIALEQARRGAFFSAPPKAQPKDKKIGMTRHNPYAPVFPEQW